MYRGADLVEVLRLAALLSAVGGGLPRRTFDALRQELLHTYGHQHLLTLNTLERAGGRRNTGIACVQRQQPPAPLRQPSMLSSFGLVSVWRCAPRVPQSATPHAGLCPRMILTLE